MGPRACRLPRQPPAGSWAHGRRLCQEASEKPKSGQARARRISPARTTSRRPRFQQTVGRATDHRTVPTDRRWFVRRRGLVGTHPTAENLDRSSEMSGAPLSLLMRSPVRRRLILDPTLSARSLSNLSYENFIRATSLCVLPADKDEQHELSSAGR
jgi:hypothetical protein